MGAWSKYIVACSSAAGVSEAQSAILRCGDVGRIELAQTVNCSSAGPTWKQKSLLQSLSWLVAADSQVLPTSSAKFAKHAR